MGINSLLPLLKGIVQKVNINTFSGLRVGVDTYCWLHRAVHAIPLLNPDYAKVEKYGNSLSDKKSQIRYVEFCMKRVSKLRQCGIEPIMVFDGAFLPMKQATETSRAK